MANITTRINLRNDALSNWLTSTVLLNKGEVAFARLSGELSDRYEMRVGVGNKTWSQLSDGGVQIPVENVEGLAEVLDSLSMYVPLSAASQLASGADKLQTSSEVIALATSITNSAISALDVDAMAIAASKTITSISQTDGKISVVAEDIQIAQSQVTDLTTDLNAITSGISVLSDDVASLKSDKLGKNEFSALSNEIGLSAATSENPVVTQDDIKNLAGAMHFKGAITDLSTITSADPGDVVVIIETSKEYVYNGEAGQPYLSTNWIELGDEDLYATKGDVETISVTLAGRDTYISGVVDALSTDLIAADSYLSGAIDNKVFVDGAQAATLSVTHISQDDFHQKVIDGTIVSNEVYVVSSDYVNAYGEQVKNVADPILSDDAATKNYVDTAIAGEASNLSDLSGKVTELSSNALTGVSLNGVLFDIAGNVASLSIVEINSGNASIMTCLHA